MRKSIFINVCNYILPHYLFLIGFSFLNNHYNLLYQALIPNCKLTINILRKHLEVSDSVREYILDGDNPRIKCQRVLNLLISHLDSERNYLQFCYLFNMISVLSDLPNKIITGTYSISYICLLWNVLFVYLLLCGLSEE